MQLQERAIKLLWLTECALKNVKKQRTALKAINGLSTKQNPVIASIYLSRQGKQRDSS
jgi:hypothetical protein